MIILSEPALRLFSETKLENGVIWKLPTMLSTCCLIFAHGLATGHILRSVRGANVNFVDANITDNVFVLIRNTGFLFCVETCLSTIPCKAISYDSVLLECRLIASEVNVQSDNGRLAVSNIKTWNKTIWELKRDHVCVSGCDIFLHPRNKGKAYECVRHILPGKHRNLFKFYAACPGLNKKKEFYILTERLPLHNTFIYRIHRDGTRRFIELDERRDSCWQWRDIAVGPCMDQRTLPACIYLLGPREIAVIPEENRRMRFVTPKYLKFRFQQELHVLLVVRKRFFTFMECDKRNATVVAEIFPWKSPIQGPKKIETRMISMPIHSCGGKKIWAVASSYLYIWTPGRSRRLKNKWRHDNDKSPIRDIMWTGNGNQMICFFSHSMDVKCSDSRRKRP